VTTINPDQAVTGIPPSGPPDIAHLRALLGGYTHRRWHLTGDNSGEIAALTDDDFEVDLGNLYPNEAAALAAASVNAVPHLLDEVGRLRTLVVRLTRDALAPYADGEEVTVSGRIVEVSERSAGHGSPWAAGWISVDVPGARHVRPARFLILPVPYDSSAAYTMTAGSVWQVHGHVDRNRDGVQLVVAGGREVTPSTWEV
jgi:hypothetical protein